MRTLRSCREHISLQKDALLLRLLVCSLAQQGMSVLLSAFREAALQLTQASRTASAFVGAAPQVEPAAAQAEPGRRGKTRGGQEIMRQGGSLPMMLEQSFAYMWPHGLQPWWRAATVGTRLGLPIPTPTQPQKADSTHSSIRVCATPTCGIAGRGGGW